MLSYISYHIYIYQLPFRISEKFQVLISGSCVTVENLSYRKKQFISGKGYIIEK